jgi:hypothetical protein
MSELVEDTRVCFYLDRAQLAARRSVLDPSGARAPLLWSGRGAVATAMLYQVCFLFVGFAGDVYPPALRTAPTSFEW